MYKSVVERFILPAYGHLAVEEVEQQHIAELHHELRGIPYQANRALEIGCKLFNLAEEWKLRRSGNPCKWGDFAAYTVSHGWPPDPERVVFHRGCVAAAGTTWLARRL